MTRSDLDMLAAGVSRASATELTRPNVTRSELTARAGVRKPAISSRRRRAVAPTCNCGQRTVAR